MKKQFKFLAFTLFFGLLITSCSNDDDNSSIPQEPLGDYENGILVSAEGGPSSVSYISNDFSTVENNIYANVNTEELGVYLQSIGFDGNQAYIISDNVNTINVVNRYTFAKETAITTGLYTPRYIGFANGKGYVSNWGSGSDAIDDFIAVIDLSTNTVESTIPVGEGPEQIISNNGKIYVSHKGGWSFNNIITVIDTNTNLTTTITVNDVPDEMFINNSGELVVLCEGKPGWSGSETNATISKIDVTTNTVTETLNFAAGVHPSQMSSENGEIYYQANNEVFVMSETSSSLPTASIVNLGTINTYGMAVKGDKLYVTDAKDFASLGDLNVYDLTTNTLENTFTVGVNASKIYFN